jgi:hypothetical protein
MSSRALTGLLIYMNDIYLIDNQLAGLLVELVLRGLDVKSLKNTINSALLAYFCNIFITSLQSVAFSVSY